MKLRIAAGAAAVLVVACGTILGLDESAPAADGADGGATADVDTSSEVGEVVIGAIPGAQCFEETCSAIGGRCVEGACRVECTAERPCPSPLECPADTDCQIDCRANGACNGLTCTGGRSCSLYCQGSGCKSATCTSARCSFDCGGTGACEGTSCNAAGECTFRCHGGDRTCRRIACRSAGRCAVECAGKSACDSASCIAQSCLLDCQVKDSCPGPLHTEAATTCKIACSAPGSCKNASPLSCGASTNASIVCADEACESARPACSPPEGGICRIACGKNACKNGTCCLPDAGGECEVDAGGRNLPGPPKACK